MELLADSALELGLTSAEIFPGPADLGPIGPKAAGICRRSADSVQPGRTCASLASRVQRLPSPALFMRRPMDRRRPGSLDFGCVEGLSLCLCLRRSRISRSSADPAPCHGRWAGSAGVCEMRLHLIIEKRCLHRFSPNSELCEAQSGEGFGRPAPTHGFGAVFPTHSVESPPQLDPRSDALFAGRTASCA